MRARSLSLLSTSLVLVGAVAAATPRVEAAGSVPSVGHASIVRANLELNGVDAIAADDVWTVGVRSDFVPFMRHWDGTSWRTFIGPRKVQELYAVAHVSSNDVWVGGDNGIIHWDGSTWKVSYQAPGRYDSISSLVAISDDDVWGVGADIGVGSVTVHWDGSTWTEFDGVDPEISLTGVDADQSDDVWAVSINGAVEHWDGTSWTQLASQSSNLMAVATVASDDVWMTGYDDTLPPYKPQASMLHWDGHELAKVDVPTPGGDSSLVALSAVSPTDIWAVGWMTPTHGLIRGLIEHWDGKHWHIRPTPDLPARSYLRGVSGASSNDAYAVGVIGGHRGRWETLSLHWDGTAWSRVP
jgi:hypothetical protein